MKKRTLASLAAAMCLVGAGLSGCGKGEPPAEPKANPFAGLPFVLVPDKDGNLEPRTADGAPIQPSDSPPEIARNLRNLSPGTVLKLASPCVIWIYFNGKWYPVPC
ncbi:MAG: hypothetical protein H5U26_02875 [Immundisolibacter sp.]|jgi:hypothetical protein|uniref:hypothetical protein n=1 Tax=Immundisolibacter sp. TaxID=1934948 RepID=UPI00198EB6A0|nr:hypothetical protein [Immundisolibacter sp.]MBC7161039.1 hypothetical protein [Immundisolibacter sp.]